MKKSLEAMLKAALDEMETAVILADEADRIRTESIAKVKQKRDVVMAIRREIIAEEKHED